MLGTPPAGVAPGGADTAGGVVTRGLDINGAESNVKEISHKACLKFRIPMRSRPSPLMPIWLSAASADACASGTPVRIIPANQAGSHLDTLDSGDNGQIDPP